MGACRGGPDTPLTSPHGGSVAPQGRRRSSNFKYVLTRNQKVAYHNGRKNPHFPCDHLLDPKVNGRGAEGGWGEGECTDKLGYSLCTFFDIPHPQIWERVFTFWDIVFHGRDWSSDLATSEQHEKPQMINEDSRAGSPGFYLPHVFSLHPLPSDRPGFAVVQSTITGVQRIWRLYRRIPHKRVSWKLRWIRLWGCFKRFLLGWIFIPKPRRSKGISWRWQSIRISAIWTFLSHHKALLCWIKHFPFN